MTAELTYLTLAALWQVVHFALYALAANLQVGTRYTMGARDEPRQISGKAGRLQRAMNNHFEALILFAIAVMVITYSDKATTLTGALALLFLLSRVAYLPAYFWGLTPWRTIIWFVGFGATVSILVLALI
ncbi:MAPEG family protein [uncultured Pelagimonas sp.]|uniref:MAPEG family protein n=1 Tax=uncultured Pelagimonas sp. TaxID=1618102 RepID=UPI002632BA6B|nr:MAPEG family protein [uncultured Pelagimonas sp.]